MKVFSLRAKIVLILLLQLLVVGCEDDDAVQQFSAMPSSHTNIRFHNTLTETEYFNIIEYLYFYNGAGIAAGDIDNDGLIDLFFTANQLQNRLYHNKGDFVFEDITEKAGIHKEGNWSTGVAMADVNGDGFLDIYVCGVGNYKYFNGRNQLLINNGDLTFSDQTEQYGLAFQGFSTHAAFFDYDNDGDLDLYLLNHSVHSTSSYGDSTLRYRSDPLAGDRLYRNDLVPEGRSTFTEVTKTAGIFNSKIGYGLGVGISDLDCDGYMDIYVSNDFHENDYLYINQGNGRFREQLRKSMLHTSRFSMGNDIADINNDGLPDIVTLDMLPKDEAIIKTTAGEDNYEIYSYKLRYGYHHQFARNALQLNLGILNDGVLAFSDIAALSSVDATDWSWAPLLADFDNDGRKDLFVANGIVTRPNDLDYINFISSDSAQRHYDYKEFINKMPAGDVSNIFYRNAGDLRFLDVTEQWIGSVSGFSTGAVYADLDNDGDLDLVINNVNAEAGIFRNDLQSDSSGWLQIEMQGSGYNRFGIGSKVIAYGDGEIFYHEQMLSRGWQSSVSPVVHLGVGYSDIDSLIVIWPDERFQKMYDVRKNTRIKVLQTEGTRRWKQQESAEPTKTILQQTDKIAFLHQENTFSAFEHEKLIPHMLSTEGPDISVADINGDGREDLFICNASGQASAVFYQTDSGNFVAASQPDLELDAGCEDVSSALFDANGDGAVDLVVVGGGQEFTGSDPRLMPRMYLNDGKGRLLKVKEGWPEIFLDAGCVRPADVDNDGDTDLFIGGRVVPGAYGKSPKSYILVNDGNGAFSDATDHFLMTSELGMVTDAVWHDLNGDAKLDLIVVGEWMPITVLIQDQHGRFQNRTEEYGLEKTNGWWNTIALHDFDGDGDADFVAGNLGWNSRLRADEQTPVSLYVGDLDHNGGIDHVLTYYNQGTEHPFISRDQLVKQAPSLKRDFLKYSTFRNVKLENIISQEDADAFLIKHAFTFSSVYGENQGAQFSTRALPVEAQMFPVFSFLSKDVNDDGHIDLLAVGNLYAVQPDFGRYDAGHGLMMLGDGKGGFHTEKIPTSGFVVKGEGRSIVSVRVNGSDRIVVGRNNATPLLFK